MRKYENDTRTMTIAELEKFLIEKYGNENYSRGCYIGNKWLSIEDILDIVSSNI